MLRLLTGLGANKVVALDISKALERVWHVGLLHKPKPYRISGQIIGIILPFLSNRWLQLVLHWNSSQEHPINVEFLKVPNFVLHFYYYTLLTFLRCYL